MSPIKGNLNPVSHAAALITDDRNRVRAQCRCLWRSPWITPDAESRPRERVAERVAARHLYELSATEASQVL